MTLKDNIFTEEEIELTMKAHSCDRQEAIEKYCAQVRANREESRKEYEKTKYQRQRAAAYPSIAQQLDTLYHKGFEEWKAEIATIKALYPKPTE